MTGVVWLAATYSVIVIFIILITSRIVYYTRLPVHLRWELAPVPFDKGKTRYGGSYLEDFEWWQKPRRKTRIAPIVYMLREIFTMKAVRKGNKALWPLSVAFHSGIYFTILSLLFYVINAVLLIIDISTPVQDNLNIITTFFAVAGCVLGITGAAGLILKRLLTDGLRYYSSFFTYFHLVLLLAVFASGGVAMFLTGNYALEMSRFIKGIMTLDAGVSVSLPLVVHIIISFLFILYLPFTNMVHFITKHFTYYGVRWNDEPLGQAAAGKIERLKAQEATWSAGHKTGDNGEKA